MYSKTNKNFCVYKHTFPNGKMYIGITSKTPNNRWENGTGYTKQHQPVMYYAIQKYGWNNVKHEILFTDLTEEQAKLKEQELIKQLHTFIHDKKSNGYNMTLGGEGNLGHKAGDKVKQINRKRLLGKTGRECPNSRPIYCDGIIYDSLTEFKQKNNIHGNITQWLNGNVGMPLKWYNKQLHYCDTDFSIIKCSQIKIDTIIIYNNKKYTRKEFAQLTNKSVATICNYVNHKTKIPSDILQNGFYTIINGIKDDSY